MTKKGEAKVMQDSNASVYQKQDGAVKPPKSYASKNTAKRGLGVPGLIILLVLVLAGSVLFVGAASGWFDDKTVRIDGEFLCQEKCGEGFVEIDAEKYEKLVNDKKSFVVLIDQEGCKTADHLKEYVSNWARDEKVNVLKMMFSNMKETSLNEYVKFYPSVVVVSKGRPVVWLRADEDADSDAYNNSDAFKEWIDKVLK